MPKIVHAADLHLDSAFGGLGPEKARQRRSESRDLVDRLAELVVREGAETVLLSGDLFDGDRVYPETLERLRAALARMACPVLIAPGNHDPFTPRSPYEKLVWPENVHIFRREQLRAVALPDLGCVVHGAAFEESSRTSQALADTVLPPDGLVHLICLHGDVTNPQSAYGPITQEQIGRCGADYLALGHIHQASGVQRRGGTWWAYPGCPEGRGFDELGEKGVLVGTVEKGGAEMRFVPLCRRRYHILQIDVTDRSPCEALSAGLPATADQDVCRVIFTGETEGQGVDLPAVESAFQDRVFALELRDQTRPAQSIWARAGEESLRGLFLRELRQRYDQAATEEERVQIAQAVRFGLAALEGRDMG